MWWSTTRGKYSKNSKKYLNCNLWLILSVIDNSYHHDIEGNYNINMAKMFLTNEGPMSERVIYKLNNNRTFSASSLPSKSLLTRAELSELSFLVRKYMGFFGSNWRIISLFISTHPTFSNMFLSPQQIQ